MKPACVALSGSSVMCNASVEVCALIRYSTRHFVLQINKQTSLYLLSLPPLSSLPLHNLNPLCPMMRFLLFKTHLMTFSPHLAILSAPSPPPHSLMFSLVISVSCTLSISQYLLIYLLLCKPLMLGLCLAQPACLMRYMYKSIFLLVSFHSAS